MDNKANYIQAINFVNLFQTRQGKPNSNSAVKSRKKKY